jgi:Uma2 family endonuclease
MSTEQMQVEATVSKPTRRRGRKTTVTLEVPSDVRLYVSPTGFSKLCCHNRDLRLERTARGALIVMSPASSGAGRRNSWLTTQLGYWANRDGSGVAFDSSAGFTLPKGDVFAADAAWVRTERWNALTPEEREKGFAPICPDFIAELRSDSDRTKKLRVKINKYMDQGVRLGWLIDPIRQTVEIYRPGRAVETLKKPATLSGEEILPGFVLDLKGILFD